MKRRSIISINDLSNAEIEGLFRVVSDLQQARKSTRQLDLCRGDILATLFYESSTRTRLSFESAMLRLGGQVISAPNALTTSSAAKGETIRDTVRVVQHYADVIVMRHFLDGATRVATEMVKTPIINGGDGSHEHPTQTLCDLYTMQKEFGGLEGIRVALCGDLKYGRTVHSLAIGLARFGARIICVAPPGFEMPGYMVRRLERDYACKVETYDRLDAVTSMPAAPPSENGASEETSTLFGDIISTLDVVYLTRVQKERLAEHDRTPAVESSYAMSAALLRRAKREAVILHPLPRQDELSYAIDHDRRAAYFRQAGNGVWVRMALLALVLGRIELPAGERAAAEPEPRRAPRLSRRKALLCGNAKCVSQHAEVEAGKYWATENETRLSCYYCDQEVDLPQPSHPDESQRTLLES
ncbi:MAG: aspartate carbamoyltransferase catalytic subunit [Candidatus Tectomicrobia bacterium]|nr:aspartate carbamoyltransferase catalytic subunit [Candidatus Tectomicrobia bacterium]